MFFQYLAFFWEKDLVFFNHHFPPCQDLFTNVSLHFFKIRSSFPRDRFILPLKSILASCGPHCLPRPPPHFKKPASPKHCCTRLFRQGFLYTPELGGVGFNMNKKFVKCERITNALSNNSKINPSVKEGPIIYPKNNVDHAKYLRGFLLKKNNKPS